MIRALQIGAFDWKLRAYPVDVNTIKADSSDGQVDVSDEVVAGARLADQVGKLVCSAVS